MRKDCCRKTFNPLIPVKIKAITLRQPWAGLLVLGIKQNETRSFNTNYRGRLYIHSSAVISKFEKQLFERLVKELGLTPQQQQLCQITGCVLGHVDITNTFSTTRDERQTLWVSSREALMGDYSPGRYFWTCANPVLLDKPIPAKGQLGLWNLEV